MYTCIYTTTEPLRLPVILLELGSASTRLAGQNDRNNVHYSVSRSRNTICTWKINNYETHIMCEYITVFPEAETLFVLEKSTTTTHTLCVSVLQCFQKHYPYLYLKNQRLRDTHHVWVYYSVSRSRNTICTWKNNNYEVLYLTINQFANHNHNNISIWWPSFSGIINVRNKTWVILKDNAMSLRKTSGSSETWTTHSTHQKKKESALEKLWNWPRHRAVYNFQFQIALR